MSSVQTDADPQPPCPGSRPMLEVSDLSVDYAMDRGERPRGRRRVASTVSRGEFLGIVGESGCGKSTLLFAIAQLLASPGRGHRPARSRSTGANLVGLTDRQLSTIRWRDMSVVMQSAMNALNPVKSIGAQFKDAMRAHGSVTRRRTSPARSAEVLKHGRHRPGAPGAATRTSCPAGCGSGR